MIKIACPSCGVKTNAPDEWAGTQKRCPKCNWMILVPGLPDGPVLFPAAAQLDQHIAHQLDALPDLVPISDLSEAESDYPQPRISQSHRSASTPDKSPTALPHKPESSPQVTMIGCGVFLGVALVVGILVNAFSDKKPGGRVAGVGDSAVLSTTDGKLIPVATSKAAYDRLDTVLAAKDNLGLNQLVIAEAVLLIPSDTACHVIDIGFSVYEVRIMEGKQFGQSGFVYREYVNRR